MTRADSLRLMLYFRTDASPRRFALMPASGASIWMSRISCELGRGVQAAPGDVTALSRLKHGFESRWGHHRQASPTSAVEVVERRGHPVAPFASLAAVGTAMPKSACSGDQVQIGRAHV